MPTWTTKLFDEIHVGDETTLEHVVDAGDVELLAMLTGDRLVLDRAHSATAWATQAVETVTPKLQSTIDAAALCKMAERGQIRDGVVDAPLAFDNAISAVAARMKQIASPVSGDADILVVPDLESGNMLAKQLAYLAAAESAGVVLGARVPIALTSRADNARSRAASTAVMALLAGAHRAVGA